MKVKVLKEFFDKQENVMRRKGEEFEVTGSRYSEICAILPQFLEVEEGEQPMPQKKKPTIRAKKK